MQAPKIAIATKPYTGPSLNSHTKLNLRRFVAEFERALLTEDHPPPVIELNIIVEHILTTKPSIMSAPSRSQKCLTEVPILDSLSKIY